MSRKRIKRAFTLLGRRTINYMPRGIRISLGRSLLSLPLTGIPGVTVKLATTKDELEGAFRLVQASYLAEGFTKPQAHGLRVSKYHLLPTTSTIVAKIGDKVVATVTLIQDGAFGVPMDGAFDLAALRTNGKRIVEISALAVDPAYRFRGGMLALLTKFMAHYSCECLKPDYWVAAANPKHGYLYECVWGFTRLGAQSVKTYDFAAGAPAIPWCADLATWQNRLFGAYGNRGVECNLARYYFQTELGCLELPKRSWRKTTDPVLTPELVRYFFAEKSDVLASLSVQELARLADIYRGAEFSRSIPSPLAVANFGKERDLRFPVRCPARAVRTAFRSSVTMEVRDISLNGFGAAASVALPAGETCEIEVAIGEYAVVSVQASVAWSRQDGICGFRFVKRPLAWERIIEEFTEERLGRSTSKERRNVKVA